MKKLLMVSNGEHIAAQIAKSLGVLLTTLALGAMFLGATTSAQAQNTPAQMIEAQLPQGKTIATADKAEFLSALCSAVSANRKAAPQIAAFAADVKSDWKEDILRTVFRCLGSEDCRLLGRVLRALSTGSDSASLAALATELAPECASAFGAAPPQDEGVFGVAPGNLNPPPGSIGGGGGQGNVVAICHNGRTIFVSPQGAEAHLREHPGDTLGECQVTPITNP